ncbi:MAG: ketol-acid reductoisomerase [Oligoflexus sp.]
MKPQLFYDADANLNLLRERKIAIIGYGSQGHAHAQNLNDQGLDVKVGVRSLKSGSYTKAINDGLQADLIENVAEWADIIMMLIPDEVMAETYAELVEPHLHDGKALVFAHGFNVHFGHIFPRKNVDVFLVAPKGPGRLVRKEFLDGRGVPCLIAIHQDASGSAKDLALAYAKGIGGTRAGVFETNFREETETDLFGEQAVLCGGLSALIKAGFETLVEAGYNPVMAYFECLHEIKLITDLIYERGLQGMRQGISNTAEFGDYSRGPRVIDNDTKERMKQILAEIQQGEFAREWIGDQKKSPSRLQQYREAEGKQQIEEIGKVIRQHFSFANIAAPNPERPNSAAVYPGREVEDGTGHYI